MDRTKMRDEILVPSEEALRFVREQSRGEWGEKVEYEDAKRLTLLLTAARQEGFREGIEAAAKVAARPHEDDDRIDREMRVGIEAAIRALKEE